MNFKSIQVNEHTLLRELILEDAPIIYHAIDTNRSHLRTWLPFVDTTQSSENTKSFVQSIVNNDQTQQQIFTVWYQDEFAGLIGLKDIDYFNFKVEIGYWLIKRMTKKGIIIHSVESLIEYIFYDLEFNRIQIKCGVGNVPSSSIPKKLGFKLEGIERAGEKHKYKYIDLEIYSLIKSEWG